MKQYEKMGFDTEAALKWAKECSIRKCLNCPAYEKMPPETLITNCAPDYLLSEVQEAPKVPRWQTAKTQEDFDTIFIDYCNMCVETRKTVRCSNCKYNGRNCFYSYMSELVEVPEVNE